MFRFSVLDCRPELRFSVLGWAAWSSRSSKGRELYAIRMTEMGTQKVQIGCCFLVSIWASILHGSSWICKNFFTSFDLQQFRRWSMSLVGGVNWQELSCWSDFFCVLWNYMAAGGSDCSSDRNRRQQSCGKVAAGAQSTGVEFIESLWGSSQVCQAGLVAGVVAPHRMQPAWSRGNAVKTVKTARRDALV